MLYPQTSGARGAGFTLIELLIVIAIIAILAAILFPVFSAAREKAREVSCAGNLKQIALAYVQYYQDYDEVTPYACYNSSGGNCGGSLEGGTTLGWCLAPYIKTGQAWHCPSDSLSDPVVQTSGGWGGYADVSYTYNFRFMELASGGSDPAPQPLHISQLGTPSNDAVLFDGWGNVGSGTVGWFFEYMSNCQQRVAGSSGYSNKKPYQVGITGHLNGGNAAYADGHVKWYSTGYLMSQIALEQNRPATTTWPYSYNGAPLATIFHE